MDDQQILLLMQESPDEGLAQAVDKYGATVLTVARRVLYRNPEDAEECAADTFIKFWETAQNLDPASTSIRAYLICIARNTAINRYHYVKRRHASSLDDALELLPDSTDIDAQVLDMECTERLLEAVKDLPELNREIIIRRYFHFQPVQDIADRMGLRKSVVKNRLQYTKKILHKALSKKGVALL